MTNIEIQALIDEHSLALQMAQATVTSRTAAIADLTAQLNSVDIQEAATATVDIFEQSADTQIDDNLQMKGFKWWILGESYDPLKKTGTVVVAMVNNEVSTKESFDFQVGQDQWTKDGILKLLSMLDIFAKSDPVDVSTIENIKP